MAVSAWDRVTTLGRTARGSRSRESLRSRCLPGGGAQGRPDRRRRRVPCGLPSGLAWELSDERCAQIGSLLATYVIETVGTQESTSPQHFLDRFAETYGAAPREVAGHVRCRAPDRAPRAPVEPPPTAWAAARPRARRARGRAARHRRRPRAGDPAGGVPAGLFPMPVEPTARSAGGRRTRAASPARRAARVASLRKSCRRLTTTVDTAFVEVVEACGDPRRPDGWISPGGASRPTPSCTGSAGRTPSRPARRGRPRRRAVRRGDGRPLRGGVDVQHGGGRVEGRARRPRRPARRGRGRAAEPPAARRAVAHRPSRLARAWSRWTGSTTCALLEPRRCALPPARPRPRCTTR